jgi:hypothetical protein
MSYKTSRLVYEGADSDSKKIQYVYDLTMHNAIVTSVTTRDFARCRWSQDKVLALPASKLQFWGSDFQDFSLYWEELGLHLCAYLDDLRCAEPLPYVLSKFLLPQFVMPTYPHLDTDFLEARNIDDLDYYLGKIFSRIATIEAAFAYCRERGRAHQIPASDTGFGGCDYLVNEHGVVTDNESGVAIIRDYNERYRLYRDCHLQMAASCPLIRHRFDSDTTTAHERASLNIEAQQYDHYGWACGWKFGRPARINQNRKKQRNKHTKVSTPPIERTATDIENEIQKMFVKQEPLEPPFDWMPPHPNDGKTWDEIAAEATAAAFERLAPPYVVDPRTLSLHIYAPRDDDSMAPT